MATQVKGVPDGYWDLSWWVATTLGYDSDENKYLVEYDTVMAPALSAFPVRPYVACLEVMQHSTEAGKGTRSVSKLAGVIDAARGTWS